MADTLQCLVKCKPKCLKCKLRKRCTNPFFILLLMNIYTHLTLSIGNIYTHMKLTIRFAQHLLPYETKHTPHTQSDKPETSAESILKCPIIRKRFKYAENTPLYVEDKVITQWLRRTRTIL